MVFQVVVDDSGNEPNQDIYVLAGLLSTEARWQVFDAEWQCILNQPNPAKLEYYKFKEARALKGQFSDGLGWTEELRNGRCLALAKAASKYAMWRFEVSMRHRDFELIRAVPLFERSLLSDHPYIFLALHAVSSVQSIAVLNGITDPIEFVFDSQGGFEAEMQRIWPQHAGEQVSPWGTATIGQMRFLNEQEFKPLQAADMWAGCVRHGMMTNVGLQEASVLGLNLRTVADHMSREDVRQFALRLLAEAERRSAANPNRPLVEFDPLRHRRARKLARKPKKPTRKQRRRSGQQV